VLPSCAASTLLAADIPRVAGPALQEQRATDERFHLPAPDRPPGTRGPHQDRRTIAYWISAWWPVALGICVIALESTALFGSDNTSGPLRRVWEYIFGQVTDQRWEILHHYIRKTGHFVGYGTMGVLWLRALWMSLPRAGFLLDATLALLGTALVASADEFHQSFLPNRTGAVVLLLLTYLFLRLRAPKRLSRAA
jgi:hypothetical protein